MHFFQQMYNIIYGFFNWFLSIFINIKNKKLYEERYNICMNCENKTNDNVFCSICGCVLKAKTKVNYPVDKNNKSIGGCPLNPPKW